MAVIWKNFAKEDEAILKALLTAAGDIIYASGASTPEKLAKGANGEVLTLAAGLPSWAAAAGAPTKELFIPVTYGSNAIEHEGDYPIIPVNGLNKLAYAIFQVPHDFTSIVSAEFIVMPRCTDAAANWDIYSDYAAIGEDRITHSESDTVSTYNVTDLELFAVDISGILSALAADDIVGIRIKVSTDPDWFNAMGVRLRYS